ncbi:iron dicitrate transport regulator FecR [Bradyrhizobium sp. NAS80.1]|uniref:FecR family protein n=1 Tax=Bradyrhizobium sp. NAS80.1 TaxID=1680159 RepID=UPI0009653CF1|nr:FecR domain-containing protein [Bradyrhizobium sp. NAS80.1]OKO85540.1 iron dicitrate transport regulator FecR [Bradyrhizobium sp. NAS80.1]
MTLSPEPPESDPLLDEAIAWIVHLRTGEPTRDEFNAFKRWRSQSPAHEAAFRRAALINQRAGIVAGRLTAPGNVSHVADLAVRRSRISRRAMLGGGLAAAAAAGFAIVQPPLGLWPSWQELAADYRTAKGEQRTIEVMPEVSLDLNTQTSIALKSRQNQPTIELVSGEVVVNARRSPQGPLIVLAAGGQVMAREAHFDARCLDGEVAVTCLGGTIDVQHTGQSAQVSQGEQISYSSAGLGTRVSVDPAQVTAWQSGLLIFRDRPLASVVDEVNRYRPGKIVIVSAALRQRAVNGDFEIAKLDSFVSQVQQLTDAHVTSLPGGLIILS